MKDESEKVGLKLNVWKTKIMASGPITSWQIDEKTVETLTGFIFLGSKITADGDYGHEIKRRLLAPWKKSYDQSRQYIKKQRHYFAKKGPSGEGNGNPLQCSCLENPRDRGAWWAAVCGVAQSRT